MRAVLLRDKFFGGRSSYILIVLFGLFALGITATGILYYRTYEKNYRTEVERQLTAIAAMKTDELRHWREERLGDASVFMNNIAFSALVRQFSENPSGLPLRGELYSWLSRVKAAYPYDSVYLLDSTGKGLMTVAGGREPADMELIRRSIKNSYTAKAFIEDFYRNDSSGKIYLAVVAPIRDSAGITGILALRIDPELYLYPLINQWPTISKSAETLLVRREGDDALFLNELKFRKDTALRLRMPIARTETPAVMAVLGRKGVIEGVDYRGVPVIGYVGPVPDSPWSIVARMDITEVYEPLRERLLTLIALMAALLLSAGAGIGFVWRRESTRFYREKYEAAEALKESRMDLNRAQAVAKTGSWRLNVQSYNLIWSDETRRIFGISGDVPMTYEAFITAVHPEDREYVNTGWQEALGGKAYDIEHRIVADGEIRWVRERAELEFGEDGKLRGALGTAQDITERKHAEEEIKESESRLRRAEAIAHLGYWSMDFSTEVYDWSDEMYRIFDVSPDYFVPAPESISRLIHPDDREAMECIFRKASVEERYDFEIRIARPDGETRYLAGTSEMVSDSSGRAAGIFGTFLDITDLRRKEQELQEKNAELERFSYTISHDLKSPLVTIKTFLGYLYEDIAHGDTSRIEKDTQYMHTATDKMSRLLDELLEMSRIGRVSNPPELAGFREIVEEALGLVAGRISARGVKVYIDESAVTLYIDRARIVEVWQNLIENAVKFMGEEPAPLIEIGADGNGRETVFFVRDNGIGVEEKYQVKVFGLFEKLDRSGEGTGIGLALVKRIVELYSGEIRLESRGAGQGSCFRFTLPDAIKIVKDEVDV